MGTVADPFVAFLRANLPVRAVPSVPEVRLHQAGPRSGLRRWAETAGDLGPPYWAHVWAGGLVLARCVLDEPERVAGRRVLDFGTGSGLVAVAAMLAGASEGLAVDVDPRATAAARLNAELNGVTLRTHAADPLDGPVPDCDVVLAGDVFYASDLAGRVSAFLGRCAASGCVVLVGDPGRAYLPRTRLDPVFSHPTPDFGDAGHAGVGTVYRLLAP